MPHLLEQQLNRHWPSEDWRDVTVALAVSGGPDSMALLRAALAVRGAGAGQLVVLHYNHRLRGADSDADAAFVHDQAARWGLRCVSEQAETPNQAEAEAATRHARYDFFRRAAQQLGARYVATAHTADDQAETILHRILRGTGLDGLRGIPASRQLVSGIALVRPLLAVSRQTVEAYLAELGQPARHDTTNTTDRFTRNRLRHELLPQLEQEYNPRVREALVRLGHLASDAHAVLADEVEVRWRQAVRIDPGGQVTLAVPPCRTCHDYILRQLLLRVWQEQAWPLQAMTWDHWHALAELIRGGELDPSRLVFPGEIRAERTDQLVKLVPPAPAVHPV